MVSVPLFSKLGPASTSYILAECEVTVAVAWDDVSVRSLLDCVPMSRRVRACALNISLIHT